MPSNPVIKLKRGTYSNLEGYPLIDGALYFGVGALVTPTNDEKSDSAAYNLFKIDTDDGTGSVVRRVLDAYRAFYAKEAGYADSAAVWTSSSLFKIQDNDGSHTETNGVSVNGSASSYTLKLPATIKAAIIGNVTGTADKAKKLVNSQGADYSVGSATKPVYFANGVPVEVTSVDVSATSADKWTSAKDFRIEDSATPTAHNGGDTSVDGSAATYVLKLPTTIKATIEGRATNATKLSTNADVDYDVGSATQPIYFANGIPVVMGTTLGSSTVQWDIYGDIRGNAATASRLETSNVGSASTPVFFSDGVPVVVTSLDASLISGVISADNLPAGVKERMYVTTTENAMKALDSTSIQEGDTVRLTGSGESTSLYYVVSLSSTIAVDGVVTGTNFKFVPYSAGTAMTADSANTANQLVAAKQFSLAGGITSGANVSTFDGTQNVQLNATNLVLSGFSSITGVLDPVNGGTGIDSYTAGDILYASNANTLAKLAKGNDDTILTISGTTHLPVWTAPSSIAGVASADKLTTSRSINGTNFNGEQDITTSYWGTARNISIKDNDETNTWTTPTAVNGGSDIVLKLPATIKASITGKATTAGTADQTAEELSLTKTNVSAITSQAVLFNGSQSDAAFDVSADDLFTKYTYEKSFSTGLAVSTWSAITIPAGMDSGTYIVQIKTNDGDNTTFKNEIFSGVMSYYSLNCASTANDSNEVVLHACGKNAAGHNIYLRTRRVQGNKVVIEFCSDVALTTSDELTFTFRKMI